MLPGSLDSRLRQTGYGGRDLFDSISANDRQGLDFSLELGFFDLEVKPDNLSVIRMIRRKTLSRKSVGLICSDILNRIPNFTTLDFNHVCRMVMG